MSQDEESIREVIQTWMHATKTGDAKTVLDLMTDDVVFMMPGQQPFGKDAFRSMQPGAPADIDASSDIIELRVLGDWAFVRTFIRVRMSEQGMRLNREGYTLSIMQRCADGRWRLARDANLLQEVLNNSDG